MVTSCFFCQNLLSDFVEGILPSARHEELKKHLTTCRTCSKVHDDLKCSLEILQQLPPKAIANDMTLRITEASRAGQRGRFSRFGYSQIAMFAMVPILIFASVVFAFPKLFPWFTEWRSTPDDSAFSRYFPVLQGATDILEEQGSWLYARDSTMPSLWEEGGLSPEEFEKSFQGRPVAKPIDPQ